MEYTAAYQPNQTSTRTVIKTGIDSYKRGYDEGREDGYRHGEEKGYDEGYREGEEKGYEDGYHKGYLSGMFTGIMFGTSLVLLGTYLSSNRK